MPPKEISTEELLAVFREKANTLPQGPNELLARHLKCKQSRLLSEAIAGAVQHYCVPSEARLSPPSEMLPPLA